MSSSDSVVSLNVGGHIYTTARSTLTRFRDSVLGAMFGRDFDALRDDQGRYFIDRNGRLFEHVLNFLRTTQLVLPEDFKELPLLEIEADFYQIQPLIEALKSYKASINQPCAQDFVSFSVRHSGGDSGAPYVFVGANTQEVEDTVNNMVQTLGSQMFQKYFASRKCLPYETYVATLLGKLHEMGFTVQSFVASSGVPTWVMVRTRPRNSETKEP
ncbi:BTB/POZ domain-containing protein KCTD6-like [Branchiostoma floridae]|uniref:BTB/POZ domain-containing protein KCTD6-like n=2 Tax=Branchiostoma floridae TaxID=7739 RepID=A0A9J7LYF7_BRAFL|nr:BTB/POZ domain-containing protein KCTD6-like [Branchiostoma floridae]